MILEIQHETRFEYTEPVKESTTELRMEPVSNADQSCHSFHLALKPFAELARYQDGFGNRVHAFNLLPAHDYVQILAAGIVETHPVFKAPLVSQDIFPLDSEHAALEAMGFLMLRGPVRHTPFLDRLVEETRPVAGQRVGAWLTDLSRLINTRFQYAPETTLAHSPIDDVLQTGRGVCQDFTHVMIALARTFQVPARYVSGYIHRPGKKSQSHAWCEAWLSDLGWVGFDPTNDLLTDENFIKVAIGRDYSDVPPNKGVYRGRAAETISVRVETRELDRLPSLSWQEELPPLETPLTAIVGGPNKPDADEGQEQPQQ